jgi:hypothetical protein
MKARTACAILALTLTGCAGSGIGDVLGGVLGGGEQPQSGTVVAEVRSVDTRDQVIRVRTDGGETADIQYDSRTTVVYRDRTYEVDALEAGDLVRMDVTRTAQNEYYTDQIEVEESVQDRTGSVDDYDDIESDRLYQLSGRVEAIDRSRGRFTLRMSNGVTVTVAMPYQPRSTDRNTFDDLRSGDTVRVEGRYVADNTMELDRFL